MLMKELDVILDNGTNEPTDNAQAAVKDESRLTVLSEQFVAAKERKEALEAELKAVKAEIERLDSWAASFSAASRSACSLWAR